jgi:hypothetical protein
VGQWKTAEEMKVQGPQGRYHQQSELSQQLKLQSAMIALLQVKQSHEVPEALVNRKLLGNWKSQGKVGDNFGCHNFLRHKRM